MPDPLKDTFSPYTEACQAKLQPKANSTRHILTPRREVFRSGMATMELRSIVEALEGSPEFHRLLLETRSSLSNDYHGKAEWAWKKAIMNFFRKSAYYHTLFNGGAPSVSEVFAQYVQAFNKRLIDTCYLIPIEYVDFAGPPMDFGLFQIRRFSKSELDEVLLKKLCDNFYPEAALETDRLEQMWFVVIKEVSPARKIGKRIIPFFSKVSVSYTPYPKSVELALRQLALFDWQVNLSKHGTTSTSQQSKDMDEGWFGFNVPFVLSVDDSLLSSPVRAADPLGLDFETVVDNETGEEVGEHPAVHVSLTEDETKTFERFVRPIAEIMSTLRVTENRWEFLDIAWGYFIKAFFSPSNLEQLLWHIVALEALLGERRQGVSSRIPRRIASILGRNEEDKKAIKKAVDELYNFRSDLVHGSKVSEEIYVGHLREARNIARRTLHWFIRYLDHIQTQMPSAKEEKVPTREDILTLLDLDHSGRLRVGKLVESLPSGFPNVPEWCQ